MAKESIQDIFSKMSYSESGNDDSVDCVNNERMKDVLPEANISAQKSLQEAIQTARETVKRLAQLFKDVGYLKEMSTILKEVGKMLPEKEKLLSELQSFSKNEYSLLTDYFNAYAATMCYHELDGFDVVLIVLQINVPIFILGSIISAAFAAGCAVIVLHSMENPSFLAFLSQVFLEAGLDAELFNFVRNSKENEEQLKTEFVDKIVFVGNQSSARNFYERCSFRSFSFVCPNNTAAIILESCDLTAAIDKIFYETRDRKTTTIWKVSTAVVQESVYQSFLSGLASRIDELTDEEEGRKIKKCFILQQEQSQELEFDVPAVKILSCRTAMEGVSLLNNLEYHLGTSIWSENSSQALEVASKLICRNIWINCHGIIDAYLPLYPSGRYRNGILGGHEGILEYKKLSESRYRSSAKNSPIDEGNILPLSPEKIEKTVLSAQNAFKKWGLTKNKSILLQEIADSLEEKSTEEHKDFHQASLGVTEVIEDMTSNLNLVERNPNTNFYVVQEKSPVGVIAIIVCCKSLRDYEFLAGLITTAIYSGNAVILVVREQQKNFKSILEDFDTFLPASLINMIVVNDIFQAIPLVSNSIIQSVWLWYAKRTPSEFLRRIRECCSKTLKHIFHIPERVDISHTHILFQKECSQSKIIWLPKIDHFP